MLDGFGDGISEVLLGEVLGLVDGIADGRIYFEGEEVGSNLGRTAISSIESAFVRIAWQPIITPSSSNPFFLGIV